MADAQVIELLKEIKAGQEKMQKQISSNHTELTAVINSVATRLSAMEATIEVTKSLQLVSPFQKEAEQRLAKQSDRCWKNPLYALNVVADKGQPWWATALHVDAVAQLMSLTEDVDPSFCEGIDPPLCIATDKGHCEIVELLLARKAKVSAQDHTGKNALDLVADKGHFEIAKLLFAFDEQGAKELLDRKEKVHGKQNPCVGDGDGPLGGRPLHIAAREGNYDMAEFFIEKRCEVDNKNTEGRTPLHLAAYKGRRAVAELLLSKGAKLDIVAPQHRNVCGGTPADHASNQRFMELAQLLTEDVS